MKYHAPYGSTDPDASYVDKDVPGAVRGSAVPAAAIEDPQREIVDFLIKSGLVPADGNQLASAVQAGKVNYVAAAGTANALTAVLSPAPTALTEGMVIRIKIATTNTGAMTLNVGLGTHSIVSLLGAALIAGEMQAGTIRELVWTGTNWRLLSLSVSDFPSIKSGIGYQKLPSGIIIQWGTYVTSTNPSQLITFPIAFPTGILTAIASQGNAGNANWGSGIPDVSAPQNSTWTATQMRIFTLQWEPTNKVWNGGNGLGVNWIAIGY